MRINLLDIRTYYINIKSETKKNKATKQLLDSLGFKHVQRCPGFLKKDKVSGCSSAYENVLLSRYDKGDPFIVFEDDIQVTHFDHIIDIPDDADAIYLGVSKMGIVDGKDEEMLLVSSVKGYEHLYRIYNMLATHAVVYLNMDYAKSALEATQRCLENGIPHDVGVAENMKGWNVYAFDKPMFIQSPKFRHYTDTAISDLPNTKEVV